MHVIVRNPAKVANKYVRLLKWKLYNLSEKFKKLIYLEAFIKSEGNTPTIYQVKLRIGLPGHDAIITKKSENLQTLIHAIEDIAHLQLVYHKAKEN